MVGLRRGVDVNRTGRPDPVQVQLLSAGRTGIQDRLSRWKVLQPRQGCDCPQTVLSKEEGLVLPRLETSPHLPLDCCQPAFPSRLDFTEMCDPEAVPVRKVWFKDRCKTRKFPNHKKTC